MNTNESDPVVDLSIDTSSPTQLVEQAKDHPNLYSYYAGMLEDAKYKTAQIKLQIEVKRAELGNQLRSEDGKISEAKIDKLLYSFPDFVLLHEILNQRKLEEGKLSVLVKSLEHRMSILLTISALKRQELRQFGMADSV